MYFKKEDVNRFLFWIRPYFIFDPHPRLLQSKLKGTQKYRTFVIRIGRFFLTQMVHGGLASSRRDCNLIRDTIGWNYFRSSMYQHFLAPRHFNEFFNFQSQSRYTYYVNLIRRAFLIIKNHLLPKHWGIGPPMNEWQY